MNVTPNSLLNESTPNSTTDDGAAGADGYVHEDGSLESHSLYRAAVVLFQVFPPVIVAFGTFGNVLTVVVMRRMSAGQSTSSMFVYFTSLAVSDLFILYTGIFRIWLELVFDIPVMTMNDFFCKACMFLVYMCGMTSSWFLVTMTWQRVTSVMFPHRASLLCTRRKALATVAVTVTFFALLNAHILYGFTVVAYEFGPWCDYIDDEFLVHYDVNIYPWLDLIFTSIVPFASLIVGNSLLVWKVVQSLRVARQMTSSGANQTSSREKKASSLTVTVICISVTFFCLTLPICVYLVLYPYLPSGDVTYEAMLTLTFDVCKLLWYSNSAVNFYLYCLTGSRFRSELKRLFCGSILASRNAGVARSDISISMTTVSGQTTVSEMKEDTVDDSADF